MDYGALVHDNLYKYIKNIINSSYTFVFIYELKV